MTQVLVTGDDGAGIAVEGSIVHIVGLNRAETLGRMVVIDISNANAPTELTSKIFDVGRGR